MLSSSDFYKGILIGGIAPFLGYLAHALIQSLAFYDTKIYLVCLLINVLLLRWMVKSDRQNMANGLLITTLFFAFYIIAFKLKG